MTGLGAQPQPLHHARSVAFDQRIGTGRELQRGLAASRAAKVERDRASSACDCVEARRQSECAARAWPVDADHLGAQVGEQHRAERARPEADELHHLQAVQWTGHAQLLGCMRWMLAHDRRRADRRAQRVRRPRPG